MKIGIDISQIIYGTGVSVYTKYLVENLLLIDKENDYLLFGGSLRRRKELYDYTRQLKGTFSSKFIIFPPTFADLVWNRLHILKIESLVGKLDVFHSTDWAEPPSNAFKVTTVHDLTPLLYPELTHPKIVSTHKARFKWLVKETDRVIVPSKATKADLISLNVKKDKIKVIPEAADPYYRPASSSAIARVKKKYKAKEYLLAVGVRPRKNTQRIIQAYDQLKSKDSLKLIIVGEKWGQYQKTKGVIFTKYVSKNEIRALYSGAQVLVYPSLYEGFGIPILDAFTCKCPVVTSNCSSMPEVAGNAAVLVDPLDIQSISDGIKTALSNRDTLIKKGILQASKFTWQNTAKKTLEVYNQAE